MNSENMNENIETDNNDDMLPKSGDTDGTVSFSVSQPPVPVRAWTKQQKREVWVVAVVATVLIAVGGFILRAFGYI